MSSIWLFKLAATEQYFSSDNAIALFAFNKSTEGSKRNVNSIFSKGEGSPSLRTALISTE